jgi:anti-sigma factor RsiW
MRDQFQDHEKIARQLVAYLSHELSPKEMNLIAEHLRHCAVCSAEIAAQQRVKTALQRAVFNADAVSAALRGRIRKEIKHVPKRWWHTLPGLNDLKPLAWVAAAAFQLMTYGSGSLMQRFQRQRASDQESVAISKTVEQGQQKAAIEEPQSNQPDRSNQ